jgi:hypothetical protein
MSIKTPQREPTDQPQVDSYECERDGCDTEFVDGAAVQGSYCSQDCADRETGAGLLRALAHDHRFCASCYRPRKVVYRPADAECEQLRKKALVVRESFVGFQHLTEYADVGEHGVECSCGAVDHRASIDLCRDGEAYEWWLKRAVEQLRREGKFDYRFDIQTFADRLWDGDDIELAVGRAIQT